MPKSVASAVAESLNLRGGGHKDLNNEEHGDMDTLKASKANDPPYTSFERGVGDACHVKTDDGGFSLDYACNSLLMPQTWQKMNRNDGEPDYDLVIVGGECVP